MKTSEVHFLSLGNKHFITIRVHLNLGLYVTVDAQFKSIKIVTGHILLLKQKMADSLLWFSHVEHRATK